MVLLLLLCDLLIMVLWMADEVFIIRDGAGCDLSGRPFRSEMVYSACEVTRIRRAMYWRDRSADYLINTVQGEWFKASPA
jgi:hypothetical protein